jgi:2-hydroxy-6-oxo-6-(2'-aminophenyl)hexa-2,4-dienoate hydrolase
VLDKTQTEKFDSSMPLYDSQFIDAGAIRTHYIQSGEGDALVLVHGGGPGADSYGNWYSCLPGFAKHFHVTAVDMLGFGKTDKPDPESFAYSQDARTEHMINFLDALAAGPVNIIGNSMGGLTSLCVAQKRPDLIKRLVLMGAAGIKQRPASIAPLLNYNGTVDAMRDVVGALTHSNFKVDEALLDYRVSLSTQPDTLKAQSAAMRWIGQRGGLYVDEEIIRNIKHTTLLVGGKNDPIVTPEQMFRFLELIDDSRLYMLPYCGHWVMMEYPQEFVRITSNFILDGQDHAE